MTNDSDFVSAMYGRNDDEVETEVGSSEEKTAGTMIANGLTVKIRQGFHTVEVPSLEYVRRLESIITQQARKAIVQERALRKLAKDLEGLRAFLRRQEGTNRDLKREIDRKIDGGEW